MKFQTIHSKYYPYFRTLLSAEPEIQTPVSVRLTRRQIILVRNSLLCRHLFPDGALLLVEVTDPEPVQNVCYQRGTADGDENLVAAVVWRRIVSVTAI
jgi:hypothetical protein